MNCVPELAKHDSLPCIVLVILLVAVVVAVVTEVKTGVVVAVVVSVVKSHARYTPLSNKSIARFSAAADTSHLADDVESFK